MVSLPVVRSAHGHVIELEDGRSVVDACGGAAVACIGYGNQEVARAMAEQAAAVPYVPWAFFDNKPARELREWLVNSTDGHMTDVYIMSSGSEAVEAAMKLAREYFVWAGQPQRTTYIARSTSYHGCTLGSLSLSGHAARRAPFAPLLAHAAVRHISPYNPYRGRAAAQTLEAYEADLEAELEAVFHAADPASIAAVIMEPVVGAAMGCVAASPAYLAMVRRLCDKHGALLILDEVMCGMGRTGTLHAWQNPAVGAGVVPDLQTIGKGLAGGYAPASALLVGGKVARQMAASNAVFTHGHTYQDHPVVCAAALAVQRYVQREQLLANVQTQGARLGAQLRRLLHGVPQVGDVRGIGMFWGIELVRDRRTREPFARDAAVAYGVHRLGIDSAAATLVYYGQGCAGDSAGDHVMVCPAYDMTADEVDAVAVAVAEMISAFFAS